MGYTRQQTKQRIQEQNTYILLYSMPYYSSILMYHEINFVIKSFARSTITILYRL